MQEKKNCFVNKLNNKKKIYFINIETQQWTRQTRRKNSFDLINFPFANFKMIRTNEPFNPIIKHNQSNNAWKHGCSKCRHTPKKRPLPLSKNEGASRNEGTCVRAIKSRHWFPLEIPFDDGEIPNPRKFINFVTGAFSKSWPASIENEVERRNNV